MKQLKVIILARGGSKGVPGKNIKKINSLYDNGDKIIYWTARGTGSGLDWYAATVKQLNDWGAKYHEVKVGKPMYDLFICDKAISSQRYFND